MEYQAVVDREDLIDGDMGEMGDCSVVELLVEQAEEGRPFSILAEPGSRCRGAQQDRPCH